VLKKEKIIFPFYLDNMDIQQENNTDYGEFYIEEKGERVAELAYSWRDGTTLSLDHTEVDESLEGKGVGRQLVAAAVAYARENNYKIVPVCSYAKSVFKRVQEYSDVLA